MLDNINEERKSISYMSRISAQILKTLDQWSSALFIAAGCSMLFQVFLIGLRRYNIGSFSELWIAPPAIAALVAGIIGLVGLYPRIAGRAQRLARAGAGSAIAAGVILCVAAAWLVGSGLTGGIPQPPPGWFLAVIAAFMIAFILAFILAAAACLRAARSLRAIGYLLLVPVVSWGAILVVGVLTNMNDALKLDLYTNGIVSIAFFAIGYVLRTRSARS